MYVALLLYFICVAWMSTDHFVFVPKIFMVVSSLLLPLMLSAIVWVCERMGNEVLASFFPSALFCQQPFLMAILRKTEAEREREKEWAVRMIKCAFKVSPKYGCLCLNRYEWKVQNSYLCTSVLNYIYYISMRLAIANSCSLPSTQKNKHLPFYQRFIVVNGFVCFV